MTYQEKLAIKAGYDEAKYQAEVLKIKPKEIVITAEWAKHPHSYIWAQGFNRFVRGEKL